MTESPKKTSLQQQLESRQILLLLSATLIILGGTILLGFGGFILFLGLAILGALA